MAIFTLLLLTNSLALAWPEIRRELGILYKRSSPAYPAGASSMRPGGATRKPAPTFNLNIIEIDKTPEPTL